MIEIKLPEITEPPEAILRQLAALEYQGRGCLGRDAFLRLYPFWGHKDFLVSSKAFLTLGRIGVAEDAVAILAYMTEAELPHRQLQVLDTFWQIPQNHEQKALLLCDLLQKKQHPTVLRGLLWLLAQCNTTTALAGVADFLLSQRKMQIKDEVLNEVWFSLADSYPEVAQALIKTHAGLDLWLRHRTWQKQKVYNLYPAPDYLWQIAKQQGINQKDFQRIYYYPRQKHVSDRSNCPG